MNKDLIDKILNENSNLDLNNPEQRQLLVDNLYKATVGFAQNSNETFDRGIEYKEYNRKMSIRDEEIRETRMKKFSGNNDSSENRLPDNENNRVVFTPYKPSKPKLMGSGGSDSFYFGAPTNNENKAKRNIASDVEVNRMIKDKKRMENNKNKLPSDNAVKKKGDVPSNKVKIPPKPPIERKKDIKPPVKPKNLERVKKNTPKAPPKRKTENEPKNTEKGYKKRKNPLKNLKNQNPVDRNQMRKKGNSDEGGE